MVAEAKDIFRTELGVKFASALYEAHGEIHVTNFPQRAAHFFSNSPPLAGMITDIADSMSNIPVKIVGANGMEVSPKHPVRMLIDNPQPMNNNVFGELMRDFLIYGCCFAEGEMRNFHADMLGDIMAIWRISPIAISVESSIAHRALPTKIKVNSGGAEYMVSPMGKCSMFSLMSYNPYYTRPEYMITPADIPRDSILCHMAMCRYNKDLAQNNFRPAGIFSPKAGSGYLTNEQLEDTIAKVNRVWNTLRKGNEPIVTNEMDYQAIAQNSMEADFNASKDSAVRDIAMMYQYPTQYLNLPGNNGENDTTEARRSFYTRAVIPKSKIFWRRFEQWIKPFIQPELRNFRIIMDINSLEGIAEQRAQMMAQLEGVTYLTANERRALAGMPRIKDPTADILMTKSGMMPLKDATADPGGEFNDPKDPKDGDDGK